MLTEWEITATDLGEVIMHPENHVDLAVINHILAPRLIRPVDGRVYAVFASGGNHWVMGIALHPIHNSFEARIESI